MDIKDIQTLLTSEDRLIADANYYKFIFKKTEKIACAVFYVLGSSDKSRNERAYATLELAAQEALNAVLVSLSYTHEQGVRMLAPAVQALVALQSAVHLAQAAGVLSRDVADVFVGEVDTVLRSIRPYAASSRDRLMSLRDEGALGQGASGTAHTASRARTPVVALRTPGTVETSKGHTSDRQQAIKDILASQGQATIKDISAHIKDCSEKTIQRELTQLIDQGQVVKEGERRWSRYSLAA